MGKPKAPTWTLPSGAATLSVWGPKIVVTPPTSSRLSPQVASSVSMMRP